MSDEAVTSVPPASFAYSERSSNPLKRKIVAETPNNLEKRQRTDIGPELDGFTVQPSTLGTKSIKKLDSTAAPLSNGPTLAEKSGVALDDGLKHIVPIVKEGAAHANDASTTSRSAANNQPGNNNVTEAKGSAETSDVENGNILPNTLQNTLNETQFDEKKFLSEKLDIPKGNMGKNVETVAKDEIGSISVNIIKKSKEGSNNCGKSMISAGNPDLSSGCIRTVVSPVSKDVIRPIASNPITKSKVINAKKSSHKKVGSKYTCSNNIISKNTKSEKKNSNNISPTNNISMVKKGPHSNNIINSTSNNLHAVSKNGVQKYTVFVTKDDTTQGSLLKKKVDIGAVPVVVSDPNQSKLSPNSLKRNLAPGNPKTSNKRMRRSVSLAKGTSIPDGVPVENSGRKVVPTVAASTTPILINQSDEKRRKCTSGLNSTSKKESVGAASVTPSASGTSSTSKVCRKDSGASKTSKKVANNGVKPVDGAVVLKTAAKASQGKTEMLRMKKIPESLSTPQKSKNSPRSNTPSSGSKPPVTPHRGQKSNVAVPPKVYVAEMVSAGVPVLRSAAAGLHIIGEVFTAPMDFSGIGGFFTNERKSYYRLGKR